MIDAISTMCRTHCRLVLLTAELFWIIVFLLERAGRGAVDQVPQFVYVNF